MKLLFLVIVLLVTTVAGCTNARRTPAQQQAFDHWLAREQDDKTLHALQTSERQVYLEEHLK